MARRDVIVFAVFADRLELDLLPPEVSDTAGTRRLEREFLSFCCLSKHLSLGWVGPISSNTIRGFL